jgi:hypothetical protein
MTPARPARTTLSDSRPLPSAARYLDRSQHRSSGASAPVTIRFVSATSAVGSTARWLGLSRFQSISPQISQSQSGWCSRGARAEHPFLISNHSPSATRYRDRSQHPVAGASAPVTIRLASATSAVGSAARWLGLSRFQSISPQISQSQSGWCSRGARASTPFLISNHFPALRAILIAPNTRSRARQRP